jgi:hypothetical protein
MTHAAKQRPIRDCHPKLVAGLRLGTRYRLMTATIVKGYRHLQFKKYLRSQLALYSLDFVLEASKSNGGWGRRGRVPQVHC